MATDSPIRVVIIGGGIAGATLANALQAYPHISAELYESAPEFPDSGLGVGLAMNAQSALKQMLPNADEIIEKSGAVPMKSTRLVLVGGVSHQLRTGRISHYETIHLPVPSTNRARAPVLKQVPRSTTLPAPSKAKSSTAPPSCGNSSRLFPNPYCTQARSSPTSIPSPLDL